MRASAPVRISRDGALGRVAGNPPVADRLCRPGLQHPSQRMYRVWRRAVLVVVPVHQGMELPRDRLLLGSHLAAFTLRVVVVASAEESPLAAGERVQYPVAPRVGGAVGDTVLVDVDDDARAERPGEHFARRAVE